jgi:hypothetical protein
VPFEAMSSALNQDTLRKRRGELPLFVPEASAQNCIFIVPQTAAGYGRSMTTPKRAIPFRP